MPRKQPVKVRVEEEGSCGSKRRFQVQIEADRELFATSELLVRRKALKPFRRIAPKEVASLVLRYTGQADSILAEAVRLAEGNGTKPQQK